MPEIRVLLPALRLLAAETPLPYALRDGKTWLRSATPRSLAALSERHRGARVTAYVHPEDMALASANLPPLTPARLKIAAAGAVEPLALGDPDALLIAHGLRSADGEVSLAWISREQAAQAQALIECNGLVAATLAPAPLWLPRTPEGWTLSQLDDCVLLRAGQDQASAHAIARADAAADAPGVPALLRELAAGAPASTVWIGETPVWWPPDRAVVQGREFDGGVDEASAWGLPLARRGRGDSPSWRGPLMWAAIAAAVWIGGLQLHAGRLERAAGELRAQVHERVKQVFPAVTAVTDPLRQVRQQLQGGAATQAGQAEFAFLLGAARRHLAQAGSEVGSLRYAEGALDVELAPGARLDAATDGIKAAAKEGVAIETLASGWRLRRAPAATGAAPAAATSADRASRS